MPELGLEGRAQPEMQLVVYGEHPLPLRCGQAHTVLCPMVECLVDNLISLTIDKAIHENSVIELDLNGHYPTSLLHDWQLERSMPNTLRQFAEQVSYRFSEWTDWEVQHP